MTQTKGKQIIPDFPWSWSFGWSVGIGGSISVLWSAVITSTLTVEWELLKFRCAQYTNSTSQDANTIGGITHEFNNAVIEDSIFSSVSPQIKEVSKTWRYLVWYKVNCDNNNNQRRTIESFIVINWVPLDLSRSYAYMRNWTDDKLSTQYNAIIDLINWDQVSIFSLREWSAGTAPTIVGECVLSFMEIPWLT